MNPMLPSAEAKYRPAAVPGRTAGGPRPRTAIPGHGSDNEDRVETDSGPGTGSLVSVIVPTYNEAGNVAVMLERLGLALADHRYEILVVDDDSSDGTWRVAEALASNDNRIRVIRRTGERGLSSAVLAGMNASAGETLVVIDADLQHDEKKIPELVDAVRRGVDVCLGSREADGGSYGSFRRRRRVVSWVGGVMARMLLGVPVSDPMSGFFAISRARYDLVADQVNPCGFKIMLEFLARGPVPRVAEVGYFFGERMSGSTKLTGSVVMDYIRALLGLMLHRLHRRATAPRRSADTGPSTTSKEASGAG